MNKEYVLNRVISVLNLIEAGVSIDTIKLNLEKYVFADQKKKIIINKTVGRSFGFNPQQIQVSIPIVTEMAVRGDTEAKNILQLKQIIKQKQGHYIDPPNYTYAYINRSNQTLVKIIEENKMKNNGSNTLIVYEVPNDDSSYIINTKGFAGEYIIGMCKQICQMDSFSGDIEVIQPTESESRFKKIKMIKENGFIDLDN